MARTRKKPAVKTLPKDGSIHIIDVDMHEKALAAYQKSLEREEYWKRLVAEGKARCIKTEVVHGYRWHYELIKN